MRAREARGRRRGRRGRHSSSLFLFGALLVSLSGCVGDYGGQGAAAPAATAQTPGATPSDPASVQAFAQTVEPLVDQHCADCHSGSGPGFPALASPDPATAHDQILATQKVNLANPPASRLVERLVSDLHHCWSDCPSDGILMAQAIAQWAALLGYPPVAPGTPEGPISSSEPSGSPVAIDDLDQDGRLTGADIDAALDACDPYNCVVRALPGIYDDVEVIIPSRITGTLTFEGAGAGATILRAPVPFTKPAVLWITSGLQQATFRGLTIDGRRREQPFFESSYGTSHGGITVDDPSAILAGPGLIENVEVKDMLTTGIGVIDGRNWIIRNNLIHDIGCSERLPCPALQSPNPVAQLNDPTWWTVGMGIVFTSAGASGGQAYGNQIWNVVKIGIEAYEGPESFYFYENAVRAAGGGIVSNGGRNGVIADNLVERSIGHGLGCGGGGDGLVFDHNTVLESGAAGMNLQCPGSNVAVVDNTIGSSCTSNPGGGGSAAHFMTGGGAGIGSGWILRGNTVDDPNCDYAMSIGFKRDLLLEGNLLQGGRESGVLAMDAYGVLVRNTTIRGFDNRSGIALLNQIDGFTVEADVSISGYTEEAVQIGNPSTVTNVVVR